MQSITKNEAKFIFLDLIGDFFYFPIWWYTVGFKKVILSCFQSIQDTEERLNLMIWIKNLFVPMFGEYDWQGRIISFFMRLAQIIFRSIFLLIWSLLALSFLMFWLILPLFILSQILYHSTVILR